MNFMPPVKYMIRERTLTIKNRNKASMRLNLEGRVGIGIGNFNIQYHDSLNAAL